MVAAAVTTTSGVTTTSAMSTASTEMTASAASEATTSATRATVTSSSAGWQTSGNSADAYKENWRREHCAAQSVQRRDFLLLGFGGIVSCVTLLSRHHQVAVVLGLMAFINA